MCGTRTHRIWMGMKDRCLNPNKREFGHYGGRGIQVCDRWHKFESFFADMGECPQGRTLERIDNDGHYEPGNCRWATQAEQLRNTRRSRRIPYEGREWCIPDLAEHLNLNQGTLAARIRYGWPSERWSQRPSPRARQERPLPNR